MTAKENDTLAEDEISSMSDTEILAFCRDLCDKLRKDDYALADQFGFSREAVDKMVASADTFDIAVEAEKAAHQAAAEAERRLDRSADRLLAVLDENEAGKPLAIPQAAGIKKHREN